MRPYRNSLSQISPAFPSGVYAPMERRDRNTHYAPVTELGSVPTVAYGYAALLDFSILRQAGIAVIDTTTGEQLVVVPYATVPDETQVAVDYDLGKLTFHNSRSGHAISVTYTPAGSVLTADVEMTYQAELASLQQYVLDNPGGGGSGTGAAATPTLVPAGQQFIIAANTQVFWGLPIEVAGEIIISGAFLEIEI